MARDPLQTKVNREFTKWAAEIGTLFDEKCHDTISERDVIDRPYILQCLLRWVVDELTDFHSGEMMEHRFADIYYQLASRHICSPQFEEIGSVIQKLKL